VRQYRSTITLLLVFSAAWSGLAPSSKAAEEELTNPFNGNAEAAQEGKRLFLKTGCYACHGHEAEGAVGPDLTDDEWIFQPTDAMIFNTIRRGRSGTLMAPFGDQLKTEEIWKIVEFLRDKNRQRKTLEAK
jgi:cytochrome c(L)